MKAVFENFEIEVDQNEIDLLSGEIEWKNLLITNENLIVECLSKDVFYTATDFVLNVSRFSDMHVHLTIDKKNSDADPTLDLKALVSQNKDLTAKLNALHDLNERFRAENAKVKQHYKEFKLSSDPGKGASAASRSKPRSNTKKDRTLPAKSALKQVEAHSRMNKSNEKQNNRVASSISYKVVQIVLWYLDSGCSKHMTGDRLRLRNFMKKFIGAIRFGNDHFGAIMDYEDYVIGDSVISRVYYVEGLGHNLFSIGQFCDSDLEVAFRKHTCFVRNLDGVDLIKGSRGMNLYTISVDDKEMRSFPFALHLSLNEQFML
ncbi:hypothetical protein Tco_1218773 [Tanacetum coccineum]